MPMDRVVTSWGVLAVATALRRMADLPHLVSRHAQPHRATCRETWLWTTLAHGEGVEYPWPEARRIREVPEKSLKTEEKTEEGKVRAKL